MVETEHFKDYELKCKHCGENHMDMGFMERLEAVRIAYGKPMHLTSAYRCPTYNISVSNTGITGPHTTGKAVDVAVYGGDALKLVHLSMYRGFTGIGVQQKGDFKKRFVHLDRLDEDANGPRPWIWTY